MVTTSDALARLAAIGWRDDDAGNHFTADATPVRIVARHRAGYVVHNGVQEFKAQPAPHFLKTGFDPTLRPAVGDFALLGANTPALIETVLPRRTVLSRAAAGEHYARQIIATNIDHVLVLMGLDGDFNPRRIERYLLLIQGSGAQPIIILSKMDLVTKKQCGSALAEIQSILPSPIPVYAINAKDAASVTPLLQYLCPGDSVVLVGSSGAGKSTLTNTLLGSQRQATSSVREQDSRGRHTTTHRALIQLPSGGCLIDTPGMRELKLTGEEDLSAASFADIEELAGQCRFGDCNHMTEPGCAIRTALDSGALDLARWESYKKLREELLAAGDNLEAQLKRKALARIANKALKKRLADKR